MTMAVMNKGFEPSVIVSYSFNSSVGLRSLQRSLAVDVVTDNHCCLGMGLSFHSFVTAKNTSRYWKKQMKGQVQPRC